MGPQHHPLQKAFMLITVMALFATVVLQLCIIPHTDNRQDRTVDRLGGLTIAVCEFETLNRVKQNHNTLFFPFISCLSTQ